jgi:ABC-type Fe3+ transport system substrate-binding protein
MRSRLPLLSCLIAVGSVVAIGAVQAQTVKMNPELEKVIAGARKEGKLIIRSTTSVNGGAASLPVAEAGIKKMFGVDIDIQWVPGPPFAPLAAALYQEKQAGQPASGEVYVATAVQIVPYLNRGLFKQVDWAGLYPDRIKPEMVEGDKRALRYMTGLPGINYNVKVASWVPEIKVISDVLKPQYKGKFFTTPFLAGFDVMLADGKWGDKKTEEFIRKMAGQISGLIGCEAEDRIASGETPALVLDCMGGSQNRLRFRGKGILDTHIVSDVAQRRYSYVAIPDHSAHPNAAILYTLYLSSPEGQQNVVYDYYGSDLDLYPGSQAEKKVKAAQAQGVKFTDVNVDWWKTNQGIAKEHGQLIRIIRQR